MAINPVGHPAAPQTPPRPAETNQERTERVARMTLAPARAPAVRPLRNMNAQGSLLNAFNNA
jgi:hypothetical protein